MLKGVRRNHRSIATAVSILVGAWFPGSQGCRREKPAETRPRLDRPNVVLITLDTTRADHLGCYGYFRDTSPTLDALASESIVFDRCLAPMALTLPAHTSLFTGVYPIEHGVMAHDVKSGGLPFVSSDHLRSFAQFAKQAGYATAGFISATPLKRHSGINAGFDAFDEPDKSQRRCDETNEAALRWLAHDPPAPFFLWVHYYDPHHPYAPPEKYRRFHNEPALDAFLRERDIPEQARNKYGEIVESRAVANLYDGEIRFMDDQIKVLLERVRIRPDWQRTIVVIVADHGEGLCQHNWVAHACVWDEQLRVALMYRVPGERPRRVGTVMSGVDVLPTLLGWIAPGPFDGFLRQSQGRDVLASGHQPAPVFGQKRGQIGEDMVPAGYSATTDTWKFIHEIGGRDALYDIRVDPHELNNVLARHEAAAAQLKDFVIRTVADQRARAPFYQSGREGAPEPLDPQVVEQLRTLGYIADDDAEEPQDAAPAPGETPRPGGP